VREGTRRNGGVKYDSKELADRIRIGRRKTGTGRVIKGKGSRRGEKIPTLNLLRREKTSQVGKGRSAGIPKDGHY